MHLEGSYKVVEYYDNTGFLYKIIATPGAVDRSPFLQSCARNHAHAEERGLLNRRRLQP
jgi:hypothetical protein